MKTKDIRELTDAEIVARILEESDHLLKLRLNNAISAVESPAKIRESRKTVARLKTVIRERQLNLNINKN